MDNLFNSKKLYTALYMAECLAHGVARTSGCGISPSIIQREEKNKAAAEKLERNNKGGEAGAFVGVS
jgi:hypothetical protein